MKIYLLLAVLLQTYHSVQGGASRSLSAAAWLDDEDGDNIPGKAGINYPVHATVPQGTSFRCSKYEYAGYFGDQEAGCQAYHVCYPDGRNASFLCVNGTVFHQRYYVCDWWFHFDCNDALDLYKLNLFRKVPLPVLPPVARRPFPGPVPQPERKLTNPGPQTDRRLTNPGPQTDKRLTNPGPQTDRRLTNPGPNDQRKPPKRNSGKDVRNLNKDNKLERKKNENFENMYPEVENKYKNPYENPDSDEKCNCQCN